MYNHVSVLMNISFLQKAYFGFSRTSIRSNATRLNLTHFQPTFQNYFHRTIHYYIDDHISKLLHILTWFSENDRWIRHVETDVTGISSLETTDETSRVSWTRSLRPNVRNERRLGHSLTNVFTGHLRPLAGSTVVENVSWEMYSCHEVLPCSSYSSYLRPEHSHALETVQAF